MLRPCLCAGDGNCQFEALSVWRYSSRQYHAGVKQAIIKQLEEHLDVYEHMYTEGGNLSDYIDRLSACGHNEWGCNVTLQAWCDAKKVVVAVISASAGGTCAQHFVPRLGPFEPDEQWPVYFLLYKDNHYEVAYNHRLLF